MTTPIHILLTVALLVAAPAPGDYRLKEPDYQGEDPPEIRDNIPADCAYGSVWDGTSKTYRRRRRGDPICVL